MKQFQCAFFNFTGGANGTGGWSYSGVQTEVINETHVRCNAAHLTSFVVLVSIVPAADIVSANIVYSMMVIIYHTCDIFTYAYYVIHFELHHHPMKTLIQWNLSKMVTM